MAFTLSINGRPTRVDADGDTPLLWALRDVLDLKAAKFGCGAGYCGACTVHIDGVATRACQIPVDKVGARKVTTLEGLASTAVAQKVRAAWAEVDVMQCGYCQAGQMMSAIALLSRNPKPSDSDIDAAMNGNLCRCATYIRIRRAIKIAAGIETASEAAA